MTTIGISGQKGWARMRAGTDVEVARQVRGELWKLVGRTSVRGVARDKLAVAMVRSRYPTARELFTDAMIAAVLRQPAPGRCSWDALRVLCAAGNEPMPAPTPAREAGLGAPCRHCRAYFAEREVAERERGLTAAGARPASATGAIWPANSGEPPAVTAALKAAGPRRYYGSRPLGQPWG